MSKKHIMFSYQWNSEELVSKIFHYLTKAQSIPLWMDKHGGMNEYLSTSMAEGVENCCVFVCFLTPEYQQSINCKKELMYASQLGKPIIPVLLGSSDKREKWKPSQWLGITITDLLYLKFTDINQNNFQKKSEELITKINSILGIITKEILSSQTSNVSIQDESDEEYFQISSSLILPPTVRQGPQINEEIFSNLPKKYSSEGDSSIDLLNQSPKIECNQDLYSNNNGSFFNSFTLSRILLHNRSSQSISILQLSSEYENHWKEWIPCQIKTNPNEDLININGNQLVVCSLTIKIELNGLPGVDNEHRFRAHSLLPQPLRLKIKIKDSQMKERSLLIEQINQPFNLPTLTKLIERYHLSQSNILDFVWADDCSIDVRYFALVYSSNDDDEMLIKFSFGCALSSLRSPSWNKQSIKALQKQAKQENKSKLIVHQGVFDPFFHCLALFDDHFNLQGITINIQTTTSMTSQTIPLPLQHIFNESQSF